jgi:hypothetical protein
MAMGDLPRDSVWVNFWQPALLVAAWCTGRKNLSSTLRLFVLEFVAARFQKLKAARDFTT